MLCKKRLWTDKIQDDVDKASGKATLLSIQRLLVQIHPFQKVLGMGMSMVTSATTGPMEDTNDVRSSSPTIHSLTKRSPVDLFKIKKHLDPLKKPKEILRKLDPFNKPKQILGKLKDIKFLKKGLKFAKKALKLKKVSLPFQKVLALKLKKNPLLLKKTLLSKGLKKSVLFTKVAKAGAGCLALFPICLPIGGGIVG